MSLVHDVCVYPYERGSYLSVTYQSGAKQFLAFIDDSDESTPEYDCSDRRAHGSQAFRATLHRPYTTQERTIVFFFEAILIFTVYGMPLLGLAAVVGVISAVMHAWTFSDFDRLFAPIVIACIAILAPFGLYGLTGHALPYPDTALPLPDDEKEIDSGITNAWKENDFRQALGIAVENQATTTSAP